MRTSVIWALRTFGLAERGHAVGDGLDAGEGRAAARERAQDQQDDRGLREALGLHRRTRRSRRPAGRRASVRASPTTIMTRDRADEDVGRDREEQRRLAHAAQVHDDDQDDEADRELDPPGLRTGIAEMMLSTPEATDTATVST